MSSVLSGEPGVCEWTSPTEGGRQVAITCAASCVNAGVLLEHPGPRVTRWPSGRVTRPRTAKQLRPLMQGFGSEATYRFPSDVCDGAAPTLSTAAASPPSTPTWRVLSLVRQATPVKAATGCPSVTPLPQLRVLLVTWSCLCPGSRAGWLGSQEVTGLWGQ